MLIAIGIPLALFVLVCVRCFRFEAALIEISHAHENDSVEGLIELAYYARGWGRWSKRPK